MTRYVWDDYRLHLEKAQKQKAKDKNDDHPSIIKYLMNSDPNYSFLRMGPMVGRRMGQSNEGRSRGRSWREAV